MMGISASASFQSERKSSYALFALALSPEEQMRECTDGVRADDTSMIENLLKLGHGFRIAVCGNPCLAAHIGRVQTAKIKMIEFETVPRQLIAKSDLEPLHAVCGFPVLLCR